MPRYDYACDECGSEFEVSRSFGDTTPVSCPMDDSVCRRIFRAPTFLVKGAKAPPEGGAPASKPAAGWSRHGHSHGPGGASHTH